MAETSQGAQTALTRDDFKQVVTDVVTQLKETAIDSTVHVLMEATTDRLVLVSTPEHASHVRFDIRSLQEFFAAEFLYDSTEVSTFARRLEVLAGDSHWREVMHFLLSALVENGRETELVVAVAALERLNEGNGDNDNRLVSRRLGLGAILASRLLQEGVLEQDKRIRVKLRKCIEPAFAFTYVPLINPLINVSPPDSRLWLRNCLLDSLHELKAAENIGATIVLANSLTDGDQRIEEIERTILSSPPAYRSLVLQGIRMVGRGGTKQEGWLVDVAFRTLLDERWTALTQSGVRAALEILQADPDRTTETAQNYGFSQNGAAFLASLLRYDLFLEEEREMVRCVNYGMIECAYYGNSLQKQVNELSSGVMSEFARSSGLFHLLYDIVVFSKTRAKTDLLRVYEKLRGTDVINALPEGLRSCLPGDIWDSSKMGPKRLEAQTDEQYQGWLRENDNHWLIEERRIRRENLSGAEWRSTVDRFPGLALRFWDPHYWRIFEGLPRPEFLDSEEALEPLIDRCIQRPALLAACPETWGRLLTFGSRRDPELRNAIREACSKSSPSPFSFGVEVYPFELMLPADSPLLPHLVDMLVQASLPGYHRRYLLNERVLMPEPNMEEKLRTRIGEYVSNANLLEELSRSTGVPMTVRVCCACTVLLASEGRWGHRRKLSSVTCSIV